MLFSIILLAKLLLTLSKRNNDWYILHIQSSDS